MQTPFTRHAGVTVPLICGPMYPCSNPELVAAVSQAGGLGVVQPIALTFVHGHELRAGLRYIRSLTAKPVGFNALIEASSRTYLDRMRQWIDVALEEGVKFFITSLGDPRWVCERVHALGGVVYHDVTEARWARKAIDGGADGLIAVNARAGGHAGSRSPEALLDELHPFGLPVVAAGGIGTPQDFARHLAMGYVAAQLGTRFIATPECRASNAYKQAIIAATASDIVHTERLTGVPVAVIRNAYIERLGTRAGPFARWMLRGRRRKHWMRTIYTLRSLSGLRRSLAKESGDGYWQAGMSVGGIDSILPAEEIIRRYAAALYTASMHTGYVFAPPPRVSVAVLGSDDRFPVRRIFCVGRNYADHVREMGGDPRSEPPIFFTKPADALVPSGSSVPYPRCTEDLHHEVELVVALHRGGTQIPATDALTHVYGYAVGNDLTRRDLQAQARSLRQPWDMAKGFDASAQISRINPVERCGHPATNAIWLNVNGVQRQHSTLDQMIWSVPEIISGLSALVALQPGDLIYTGTPHGIGRLVPGDVVTAGIEGLDELEFRIVAARA